MRRLAFGPEDGYTRFLGCYAAVEPRFGDTASAVFLFRTKASLRYDHRDTDERRRLLTREFAGLGWHVADLLADVTTADELYFDSVSQIRMPHGSHGRVVLVGDACPEPAFVRYQAAHRRLVTRAQRSAGVGGAVLAPATATAIRVRNLLVRATAAVTFKPSPCPSGQTTAIR